MQFNIYDEFNSQNSHQHVSAGIPAILRVIILYKNTKIHVFHHFNSYTLGTSTHRQEVTYMLDYWTSHHYTHTKQF